jgi:hypothetical protein
MKEPTYLDGTLLVAEGTLQEAVQDLHAYIAEQMHSGADDATIRRLAGISARMMDAAHLMVRTHMAGVALREKAEAPQHVH